jgi:hypothetical protein
MDHYDWRTSACQTRNSADHALSCACHRLARLSFSRSRPCGNQSQPKDRNIKAIRSAGSAVAGTSAQADDSAFPPAASCQPGSAAERRRTCQIRSHRSLYRLFVEAQRKPMELQEIREFWTDAAEWGHVCMRDSSLRERPSFRGTLKAPWRATRMANPDYTQNTLCSSRVTRDCKRRGSEARIESSCPITIWPLLFLPREKARG